MLKHLNNYESTNLLVSVSNLLLSFCCAFYGEVNRLQQTAMNNLRDVLHFENCDKFC